jgi:anti-sigma factor RsiW
MNCQQIQKVIHAHHDGELDVAHTAEVDDHLADCPRCFAESRNLAALRGALKADALYLPAPAALKKNIRAALASAADDDEPAFTPARSWWNVGLAFAAMAAVAVLFALQFYRPPADRLTAELTAGHVRSLMANHLTDVASSDQHTVKPWFDGRLDFAPPVADWRDAGFPLLGGRLDFADDRPVAALVYGRQKHFINLFVWPAKSPATLPPRTTARNGYQVVHWTGGGMQFWAVSDVSGKDLLEFARLWNAGTPGEGAAKSGIKPAE